MIFAAGLGTRLRPLTNDRPKALVEVAGRTLLEHNILKLRDAGFSHIVVNVHHFADQVISFLDAHQNFGLDIQVSDERNLLLDTGGGLRKALPLFGNSDPVLIHNVDIVSEADLRAVYSRHTADATLLVNERKTSRYLLFDEQMLLGGWTNVNSGEVKGLFTSAEVAALTSAQAEPSSRCLHSAYTQPSRCLHKMCAFSGIHVVSAGMLRALTEFNIAEAFPIMDFYIGCCQQMHFQGIELPQTCRWVDCGKVESLEKAAEILTTP